MWTKNAAKVIAMHDIKQLLARKCSKNYSKRCGIILMSKIEAEGTESIEVTQSPLGETEVNRLGGNTWRPGR
ncbi:MAG TPA: hypothetical protein DEF07_01360 [Nitrosomonas sp.]|jgi:hypothetical protein|uniref:Uncharacterized protein n=1 Tax=Nitrosomonas mobilis TaxID=51642 RepID=A0A1G5SCW7_9PROT|nr:hypothetical protein [Nitrosomonas mobilis]SCZ85044.1 hypothetical protein NSMM_330064 [Nitrosomonas mobilis]HBV20352.1 hypothetical protein [Nitrosomonas sp.]HNO75915.1 hypothetical protein [Nitrosomonas mobilis]